MNITNRQAVIASSFAAHVNDYEQFADVQRLVAGNLAGMIPDTDEPEILEIGCGTGFLTSHLVDRFPDGRFHITDLCPEMLASCQKKFSKYDNMFFSQMDGECPVLDRKYDFIASSLTVQWFLDPITNLRKLTRYLKPGGEVYYATLGNQSFREWRDVLNGMGFSSGFMPVPDMPGLFDEEFITIKYENARSFLKSLKSIGAGQPRSGYKPIPPISLRRACDKFDDTNKNGGVTWHIAYGRLDTLS